MRPFDRLGHLERLVWAAPCSLVGLLFALVPLATGGTAQWAAGALEVTYRARLSECGPLTGSLPFRGIVFGHVILAVTQEEMQRIGPHERVHVQQYEVWGPLFFIAYAMSSAWQLIRGRDPYADNCFEVEARTRAMSTRRGETRA